MHCVFVKTFDKKEYAEDFLNNGKMLFRHVSYYQGLEDGQIRGDNNEGYVTDHSKVFIKENTKTLRIGDSKFFVDWEGVQRDYPELKSTGGNYSFKLTYIADVQIFCMTYINGQMQNMDDIVETLKGFGQYCVVIVDCGDFLNKISKIKDVAYVRVKYSNTEEKNLGIKRELYKNQSEFRVIKRQGGEKSFETLGKLKGFICSPDDLLLFLLLDVKEIG